MTARRLVSALEDAHALAVDLVDTLEGLAKQAADRELRPEVEELARGVHAQAARVEERLRAHGREPSTAKDLGATLKATAKGFTEGLRDDGALEAARDAYTAAHAAVAAYAVLELLAGAAGDDASAAVARESRREEEALAGWIDARWRRFAARAG